MDDISHPVPTITLSESDNTRFTKLDITTRHDILAQCALLILSAASYYCQTGAATWGLGQQIQRLAELKECSSCRPLDSTVVQQPFNSNLIQWLFN